MIPFRRSSLRPGLWRVCYCTPILVAAMIVGCRRHYPMGKLSVRVLDAEDSPVRGVAADLFKRTPSGLVYWRASRTDGDGLAKFGKEDGVIEGDYVVRIGLMPWQKLGREESNNRPVKVTAGDDIVLTFRVVPRRPAESNFRPTP